LRKSGTKIKGKLLTTFIHQITKLKDVFAFSLIVDKRNYPGDSLTQKVKNNKGSKHKFSDFCTMYVIKKAKEFLKNKLIDAELILDRIERQHEENFNNYIYSKLNQQDLVIGRITHVDSLCVPYIQLTDILSGVIRDEVEDKKARGKDHSELWKMIKKITRLYNIEREINLKKVKVE